MVLFREKNNDKFHVMTTSSLDFCINLGKVKSCSVRDARFTLSGEIVIPVEFALNRFLLISTEPYSVKMMGRCPSGMVEHTFVTDSVLLVPVNCSYIGKQISIDTRKSDSNIISEIGIVHFDKLEVSAVSNPHRNLSEMSLARISNATSNSNFERNRKLIDEQLRAIDTKHDNMWSQYAVERWTLVGTLCLIGVIFLSLKLLFCYKAKKTIVTEIELPMRNLATTNDTLDNSVATQRQTTQPQPHQQPTYSPQLQQQQQQTQPQHQQQQSTKRTLSAVAGAEHVYTEVSDSSVNFGLPSEQSQFYNKAAK